jgi:glyoxylase-like metal-dependent hydrolase (beta-lactamase superfamily II)
MMNIRHLLAAVLGFAWATSTHAETTEFCLVGEFDLGARYQGMRPQAGELYPARWCVTTADDSDNVLLSLSGNSNPDMQGSWTVAFIPPDLVRIVNADSPPDVEFRTPKAMAEALRTRMLDPRRADKDRRATGNMMSVQASVALPLRGRVPVSWTWQLPHSDTPSLEIDVGGQVMFRGAGSRRTLDDEEVAALWLPTAGADPIDVPGDRWPARVAMELVYLSDGIYLVQGVRTGFHHMIVDTDDGLVVADAPAGWVELHQFPPVDMVPGLGVSGLSEQLVDFLGDEFPGRPIRAVALTHHHDDHAGGARAFAAAGAYVYAPAEVAPFLGEALNRESMPPDRRSETPGHVIVRPVDGAVTLDDEKVPVRLINMGKSPHAVSSLGVLAGGYFFQSDLHVPNSDAEVPRSDRVDTECWFAAWAVDNLPDDAVVINTHSLFQTPVSRLARYLESDSC